MVMKRTGRVFIRTRFANHTDKHTMVPLRNLKCSK